MKTEIDVIRDVSSKLDRAGIPYMITGSIAMNYYAEPRMTRDIDLVLALSPRDAGAIVKIFIPPPSQSNNSSSRSARNTP